ncbi:MAG: PAS domain S-box protein [Ferruginibacter sp.]|nr:PAS domain S-box protein [Ferruginibacter sp.]MBP6372244.1 PAS domain S-box protein [Ferruginibacter sp.]
MGILVINDKSEIMLANNFLLSQFGYADNTELVGKGVDTLIPSRYHHKHDQHLSNYNKKPERRPMGIGKDLFGIKKDGTEFPVEISLSHYGADEGNFAIAFVIDITKRKEIENAVIQQKEQLADINLKIEELNNDLELKVELRTKQLQETLKQLQQSKEELTKALSKEKELSDLKSRFVSMASHEFRTPLSTILSSASLVAKYTETEQQENRDKHIQRIKTSVNNLTDLLNEFLSIGKIEDGKIVSHFQEFNIKELLTGICNEMQSLAKTGQQIVLTNKGSETVSLDPSLLRNAVLNLLSNAIKFSPEGGIISITCAVTKTEINIVVKDSGIGISKDDQQHLFERFFRGTNATNIQGTGLGLHIVSKYIELMDGQISFKSELEKGTEFIITFKA